MSPPGCLTGTLNLWFELSQPQANPSPAYLWTLAQAFPTNLGVTLKLSHPKPSPCEVLLAPPPKVSEAAHFCLHRAAPTPVPAILLFHLGSCKILVWGLRVPLLSLDRLHSAQSSQRELYKCTAARISAVFHPTKSQIHHPHKALQDLVIPSFPCLQTASRTGHHTPTPASGPPTCWPLYIIARLLSCHSALS